MKLWWPLLMAGGAVVCSMGQAFNRFDAGECALLAAAFVCLALIRFE